MNACSLSQNTITRKLMDAVLDRLTVKVPSMANQYFPDSPNSFSLTHPNGSFLLNYGKSSFSQPVDTCAVAQVRTLHLVITTVMRSLNDREGMIAMLDQLRYALVGFKAPNCRRKMWVESEHFLGENAGIWMYQTTFATELMQIELGD